MALPTLQNTNYAPTGLRAALKRVLGEHAQPLPPDYRVDPRLLMQTPTQVSRLSNGLRVATEEVDTPTATVGLWLDTGTRFEPAAANGVAHFLEHLIFKGTGRRTQHQLEVEVEDMGAQLNAYTSREQTVYFARCLGDSVPRSLGLLADILQNSLLDAGAVERERDVILREMEDIESQPEEVLFDYLHSTAFQGTPLARTILGTLQNIQTLKREDLVAYIESHYQPHRMVLVTTRPRRECGVGEFGSGRAGLLYWLGGAHPQRRYAAGALRAGVRDLRLDAPGRAGVHGDAGAAGRVRPRIGAQPPSVIATQQGPARRARVCQQPGVQHLVHRHRLVRGVQRDRAIQSGRCGARGADAGDRHGVQGGRIGGGARQAAAENVHAAAVVRFVCGGGGHRPPVAHLRPANVVGRGVRPHRCRHR
eukprot:ctg_63.g11